MKLYSPVGSAVALLPETVCLALASVAVGALTGILKKYRWALWIGWVLTTLGCGLLYKLNIETTVVQWIFLNIPFGIGTGMLFTAEILAIQAAVEYVPAYCFINVLGVSNIFYRPELNGAAAGFFSFIRVFGQALGIAVSGVIFQNSLKQQLLRIPGFASLADEYSRDATAISILIQGMADGETKMRIMQAFSDALSSIWLTLTVLSAVGLLLSLTVKGYSMTQEHVTAQHLVQEKDTVGNEEAGVLGNVEDEKC